MVGDPGLCEGQSYWCIQCQPCNLLLILTDRFWHISCAGCYVNGLRERIFFGVEKGAVSNIRKQTLTHFHVLDLYGSQWFQRLCICSNFRGRRCLVLDSPIREMRCIVILKANLSQKSFTENNISIINDNLSLCIDERMIDNAHLSCVYQGCGWHRICMIELVMCLCEGIN
jgi:hypothetical protein